MGKCTAREYFFIPLAKRRDIKRWGKCILESRSASEFVLPLTRCVNTLSWEHYGHYTDALLPFFSSSFKDS